MPNIHHLQLFYYVAVHRGISRATRHMPYRISQPAVSAQIGQLESELGCTLFQRHPFQLTSAGAKLYAHLRLSFENLEQVLNELRGPGPRLVRLASTPLILREYLPRIVTSLRRRFPEVLFVLSEGSQREIDQWFESQEADFVVNVLEGRPPPGCHVQPLVKLPIVLLVSQDSPVRSLKDLLQMDPRKVHLLLPAAQDAITLGFRRGLARWPAGWKTAIQANSLELIETYAREGHGIGVSVLVPGRPLPPLVRAVSLPGFPAISVGALWRGPRDPVTEAILQELKKQAKAL